MTTTLLTAQTPPNVATSPALEHFVALARKGDCSASSNGEIAAHELAQAALAYATNLDQKALNGLIAFVALAKMQPYTARDLIV